MSAQTKPYQIIAKTGEIPVIMLHGYIGSYDTINAADFMREFNAATANSDEVIFNINSGGGSVIEGFSIIDQIKATGKKITTQVFGMAGSMGFVMMLLGDKIQISRNSNILVHRVSSGGFGDAETLKAMADKCQEFENSIIAMTVARTKLPEETVKSWFKSGFDKWFNANEALQMNLVDEIIGAEEAPKVAQNMSEKDVYNKFYNTLPPKQMKKEHLLALGLPENATDEQVTAKLAELNATLTALKASQEAAITAAAEGLINTAIKAGKIKADAKEHFVAMTKNVGYDNVKAMLDAIEVTPVVQPPVSNTPSIKDFLSQNTPAQSADDRKNWNFIDWAKKDPTGLAAMTNEAREALKQK